MARLLLVALPVLLAGLCIRRMMQDKQESNSPLTQRGLDCYALVAEALAGAPAVPLPSDGAVATGSWVAERVVESYKAGKLDDAIGKYRQLLFSMPGGEEPQNPRGSGVGHPWGVSFAPVESGHGKPKLILTGDSITHGAPLNPSAPYALAVAKRNPSLFVENIAWGGIMSMSLLSPKDFNLPLPSPGDVKADFVCIFVGANDAMFISSNEKQGVQMYVGGAVGGPCRLPEDWVTRCRPSVELFEASIGAMVRSYKAAGARVAVATPMPLGEDTTGLIDEAKHRLPPLQVVRDMVAAVHRVAAKEGCAVLPLFECADHYHRQLKRPPLLWTAETFMRHVYRQSWAQEQLKKKTGRWTPWVELREKKEEQDTLMHDLVHFSEHGGALYAALVQAWLDAEREEASPALQVAAAAPEEAVEWLVVGGADKGILVRSGRDFRSAETGRLSAGSVVEQLELQGERLSYKKLSGDGPDHGWVSLSVQGKPLLQLRR